MKEKLIESIHHRFVFAILSACTFVSVLLVGYLLAGCSLARTDDSKGTATDRLCGLWVINDTNIYNGNPEGFKEDDANYIGIEELTDTSSDTTDKSNQESSSGKPASSEDSIITRGNILLKKCVLDNGDVNTALSVTGSLYLSSDKPADEYVAPIYQRPDGTYYRGILSLISCYAENRIPTPLSIASTETYSSSEGVSRSNKTEITIDFEVRDACTGAQIIEMDKDSLVIRTTALDLDHSAITGSSEYEITTLPETESVIIEESSGEGPSAKIYRTIYCRSEESEDIPVTHIIAVPGENEVLIPQKLQISFG